MEGEVELRAMYVDADTMSGRLLLPMAVFTDTDTAVRYAFDCNLISDFEIWRVTRKADGTIQNEYQTGTWTNGPNKKTEQRKRVAELEGKIDDLFEELATVELENEIDDLFEEATTVMKRRKV